MFCPNPDCLHRERTGRAADYLDGVTVCADCDSVLVHHDPTDPVDPAGAHAEIEGDDDRLTAIGSLIEPARAALARSVLEDAGIHYVVRGDGVQDLFAWGRVGTGFNPVTGPPMLLVEKQRADEARALLESLEHGGEIVPPEEFDESEE
jgi:hypothetical protein